MPPCIVCLCKNLTLHLATSANTSLLVYAPLLCSYLAKAKNSCAVDELIEVKF